MENSRYHRQLILQEIGAEGQRKLLEAKVLLIGVGGLGSPISMYLAGAGVGKLGIVDCDVVSLNNLPRQVLYTDNQIGLPKVFCAAERLRAMNPEIEIVSYNLRITADNAREIFADYDIIVDGVDNFATRYLISDLCAEMGKPYVFGAIKGLEGMVSVFCATDGAPTYRTLFPDEQEMTSMPHPGKEILGTTPGFCAMIQATEVVKLICGFGENLKNKLLTFNLMDYRVNVIEL